MNRLIKFVLILTIAFPLNAFADCDFSKDIKKTPSGTYEYTKDCHIKVGEINRDLKDSKKQIEDLTKAISLKNLALKKADERADNWMNTTFSIENKFETAVKMKNTNEWMYFGLGILTFFAATEAVNQLNRR